MSLTAWFTALFAASALFSHNVTLRLLLLGLGLVSALGALTTRWRELRPVPTIWWSFLLWAAWAALSLTWSIEPGRSDKEFRNEVVYTGLALWMCYIGAQAPGATRTIIGVVSAATTLLCAVAFYSFMQGAELYFGGWHGGPGGLSSSLLMLLPCVVAAGWYGRRTGWRPALPLALGLAVLILVAGYTTLNRTVWIGFAVELLLVGALIALRRADRSNLRVRATGAALAASVIAGCTLVAVLVQTERVEVDPTATLERDPRAKIWPEVWELIESAPLTGYGFGRGLFRRALTDELGSPLTWHAHNLFLDTALQTGIPGLLLFLLLLGLTAREGWRAVNRAPDDATVACGLALLGLTLGMVIRNMTDTLLVRQNSLFFWAAVGILLGLMQQQRAKG